MIAAIFNLWIGSPTINNNAYIIPDNVYKTECRIVLLDYYGEYYWSNAIAIVGSGIYDTKEKAVKEALEAIKNRDKLFNMQNIKGADT